MPVAIHIRMRGNGLAISAVVVLLAAGGDGSAALRSAASSVRGEGEAAPRARASAPTVQIEMRNVRLHVAEGVVLDVRMLRGTMISRSGAPPVFDDAGSYVLEVDEGTMSMDLTSLGHLLNDRVFAYDGAPLKDIEVRGTSDGRLEQKGKLHKGIDVPFSMKASVSPTPDGQLRLHLESMKAAGVPAKGLMKMFGLELDDLVSLERTRGVTVRDSDITIGLGRVLPPPEMRGRLTAASVQGDRLMQTFAPENGRKPRALAPPDPRAHNYIYFSGGSITFGKLTMRGADLQLIDADDRDAFDFSPAGYKAQLVAGYSKNTPAGGLKTYMPDLDDLRRGRSRNLRPRQ